MGFPCLSLIEINEMEEADAISLLLKASYLDASAEHIEVARNIVTELGCMPLAVNQAGAYIEVGRCSINKYLQQFSLHRQTLMSDATFISKPWEMAMSHYVMLQKLQHYAQRDLCYRPLWTNLIHGKIEFN